MAGNTASWTGYEHSLDRLDVVAGTSTQQHDDEVGVLPEVDASSRFVG